MLSQPIDGREIYLPGASITIGSRLSRPSMGWLSTVNRLLREIKAAARDEIPTRYMQVDDVRGTGKVALDIPHLSAYSTHSTSA